GGHVREAEAGGDQRTVVAFPGELLRVHRGDHERVGPLDARVVHGGQGRLRDEVLEVLVAPAEPGHPRAGDPHVAHPSISNRGVTGCQRVCAGLAATTGGPPASTRRAGIVPGGTRISNSRIKRSRYVRCRPSARAARVRLPPAWVSVASIRRRLKSETAPWKPGSGRAIAAGGADA